MDPASLATSRLSSPLHPGDGDIVLLHGIIGSGRNWRGIGRRLAEARPDLGVVTVDLRNHGASQGLSGPDTLEACAGDLARVEAAGAFDARVVIGHSFGGKVAMVWARWRRPPLAQLWVLDTMPGADHGDDASAGLRAAIGDVSDVLDWVDAVAMPAESRAAVVAALRELGAGEALAAWLGTSVVVGADGARWVFEPTRLRAMLADYAAHDAWDVLEAPPAGVSVHFVRAGRSPRWRAGDVARLARAAARPGHHADVWELAEAGHWLHTDDPEGLVALIVDNLPPAVSVRA